MTKWHSRAGALAAAVLMIFCMAACGGDDDKSGGSSAVKGVTLNVVTMFGGDDEHAAPYAALNQSWQEKTGNMVSDQSAKSSGTWKNHVIDSFNKGLEPDVLFFFGGATAAPIMEYVTDIETIRAVDPSYGDNISDSYIDYPTGMNAAGKPVLLPMKIQAEGIFCNKTLFNQYGVLLPTDWASLTAAVNTFKQNGVVPFSVSLNEGAYYYFDHLILAAGGKAAFVDPAGLETPPDSWVSGMELLKTMYDMGAFSQSATNMREELVNSEFLAGESAMLLEGSWLGIPEADAPVTQDDIEIIPFPLYSDLPGEEGTVLVGVPAGWFITKKCWDNPDKRAAAIDYVKHQTSNEAIARYVKAAGGLAATKEEVIAEADMTRVHKQFLALLDGAPLTLTVIQDNLAAAANQVYLKDAAGLATGNADPRTLLQQLLDANR